MSRIARIWKIPWVPEPMVSVSMRPMMRLVARVIPSIKPRFHRLLRLPDKI